MIWSKMFSFNACIPIISFKRTKSGLIKCITSISILYSTSGDNGYFSASCIKSPMLFNVTSMFTFFFSM